MYLFLLPFFHISELFSVSFIIISYIFTELILLKLLKSLFDIETNKLIFPIVLNPIIIYSVAIKGYLDFIPLLFFIACLYNLKNKKYSSAMWLLALGVGTKVVFIILFPLLVIYSYMNLSDKKEFTKMSLSSLFLISLFYFPMITNPSYSESVIKGITEGADVLQFAGIFDINTLIISEIIILITYYFFWKNLRKMDYFGLVVCLGVCTFPLFILNFSNIGWFMWSVPAILYIFISLEDSRQYLIYFYFLLVVLSDSKILITSINEYLLLIQFFLSLIVIKYFYQFLIKNKYFRTKQKPILIAIAGDSGVGKSTITKILSNFFGTRRTSILEIDNYHKYERSSKVWKTKTHLDPIVNNLSLYKKQLVEIISGNIETVREYNHLTGTFDEIKNIKINDFLIIEGLHTLIMEDINKFYNLKIYVDLDKELKNNFKLERDLQRNKSENEIHDQIKARENDFKKFIIHQKENSDLSINTLKIDENNIKVELIFQTEYLENLLEIFEKNNVEIISLDYTGQKSKVLFKSANNNPNLMNDLIKNLNNIRDDLFYFQNDELNLKSSLIIFFLSKKLELL
tara:strand:+ start:19 stop:1734 length:1716 start_codon:yes stop_codon:yes gene_type:complete